MVMAVPGENCRSMSALAEGNVRPTLNVHLLVKVYGYNNRERLRDDLGTNSKTLSSSRGVIDISRRLFPYNQCLFSYAREL